LPAELRPYPRFRSLEAGLKTRPDLVVIATYADSHAELAIQAMEQGAHVFVEKPLATTVADAERVWPWRAGPGANWLWAISCGITRPWTRLIAEARGLGGPYVFRMNLNQQSRGRNGEPQGADAVNLAYR